MGNNDNLANKITDESGLVSDKLNTEKEKDRKPVTNVLKEENVDYVKSINKLNIVDHVIGIFSRNKYTSDAEVSNDDISNDLGDISKSFKKAIKEDDKETIDRNSTEFLSTIANSTKNIATSTEEINKYQHTKADIFFKKSIELQYRSLALTSEQLAATKIANTTLKNQLEAIVKNTSLPEEGKATFKERMVKLFWSRLPEIINNDKLPFKFIKDQMVDVGSKKLFSGFQKSLHAVGSLRASKDGGVLNSLRNITTDNNRYINKLGDNVVTNTISEAIRGGDTSVFTRDGSHLDEDGGDRLKAAVNKSIVETIPELLSKIHNEVRGIRTGENVSEDTELVKDTNTGKFITRKKAIKNIKAELNANVSKNAEEYNKLIDILETGLDGERLDTKQRNVLIKSLQKSQILGNGLYYTNFTHKDILKHLDKKSSKILEPLLDNLNNNIEDRKYAERVIKQLATITDTPPNLDNLSINEKLDKGHTSLLTDAGVLKGGDFNKKKLTKNIDKVHALNKPKVGFSKGGYTGDGNPKEEAGVVHKSEYVVSKDMLGKIKEGKGLNVFKKIKDASKRIKTGIENKRLEKMDLSDLRAKFFDSKEFLSGEVNTFSEWMKNKHPHIKDDVLDEYKEKSISNVNKIKNSFKESMETPKEVRVENLKDRLNKAKENISSKSVNVEGKVEELREEFFGTKEYREGKVTDFKQWLEAQGMFVPNIEEKLTGSKDNIKNITETISKSVREKYDEYKDNLVKLTDEQEEAMKAQFFKSEEYLSGKVVDFKDWLSVQGFRPTYDTLEDKIVSITTKFNKAFKALDLKFLAGEGVKKFSEYLKNRKLKTLKPDENKAMMDEYLKDPGMIESNFKISYDSWLEVRGYKKPKDPIIKRILAKTRAWDKKIVKGSLKAGYKLGKFGANYVKDDLMFKYQMGVKPMMSLAKYAGDGVVSAMTGGKYSPLGIGQEKDVDKAHRTGKRSATTVVKGLLSKTRGIDKSAAKGEPVVKTAKAVKSVVKAPAKVINVATEIGKKALDTTGVTDNDLTKTSKDVERAHRLGKVKSNVTGKLNDKINTILKFIKKDIDKKDEIKKEQKPVKNTDTVKKINPFDRDGDGDRDGNWKERLEDKKKTPVKQKISSKIKEVAKDNKGGILGVLMAIYPFIKGIGKSLLGLPKKLLGGMTKMFSGLGSTISSAVGSVASGVKSVLSKGASLANKATGGLAGKAVAGVKSIGSKIMKKIPTGKVMSVLKSFKSVIIKKMGTKGATILSSKIAARAIPFAGAALLAYDAVKIGYYYFKEGMSLKSATSKQILGFDLFNKDEAPVDENGEPIKPDVSETKNKETAAETKGKPDTTKTNTEKAKLVPKKSDVRSAKNTPGENITFNGQRLFLTVEEAKKYHSIKDPFDGIDYLEEIANKQNSESNQDIKTNTKNVLNNTNVKKKQPANNPTYNRSKRSVGNETITFNGQQLKLNPDESKAYHSIKDPFKGIDYLEKIANKRNSIEQNSKPVSTTVPKQASTVSSNQTQTSTSVPKAKTISSISKDNSTIQHLKEQNKVANKSVNELEEIKTHAKESTDIQKKMASTLDKLLDVLSSKETVPQTTPVEQNNHKVIDSSTVPNPSIDISRKTHIRNAS